MITWGQNPSSKRAPSIAWMAVQGAWWALVLLHIWLTTGRS